MPGVGLSPRAPRRLAKSRFLQQQQVRLQQKVDQTVCCRQSMMLHIIKPGSPTSIASWKCILWEHRVASLFAIFGPAVAGDGETVEQGRQCAHLEGSFAQSGSSAGTPAAGSQLCYCQCCLHLAAARAPAEQQPGPCSHSALCSGCRSGLSAGRTASITASPAGSFPAHRCMHLLE